MTGADRPASGEGNAESASPNALPAGTRISDFEISGIIGEGGFGIVYRAFDHTLHRQVALKEYMPKTLATRRDGVSVALRSQRFGATFAAGLKSFVNEARLLAQFDHPALVKVFRFWEQNDTAYMVMPLYEGRTLKEFLREHPGPDEGWLKALAAPLLDALESLHAVRCFHRDVAPDNILVLDSGAPVLLDFGAARRIIGEGAQDVTVILKPGYAPVEQYADDATVSQGPWTDIYAMAAVLRFAITGKAPPTSVTRVVADPVHPLVESVTGYSREFLHAIDSGFAVRPEDRPQSVADFRHLLGIRTMAPSQRMSVAARPPVEGAPERTLGGVAPAHDASADWSAPMRPIASPVALPESPRPVMPVPAPFTLDSVAAPKPAIPEPASTRPTILPDATSAALRSGAPVPAPFTLDSVTGPKPAFQAPPPPVAQHVERVPTQRVEPSPPPKGMGRRGWLVVGGGVVLAVAVIAGVYLAMRPATDASGPGAKSVARAPTVESNAIRTPATPVAAPAPPDASVPAAQPARADSATLPRSPAPTPDPAAPPVVAGTTATAGAAAPPVPAVAPAPAAAPPVPAAPPPTGRIVLDIKPWGEVYVNGRSRGLSPPMKNLQLPEGRYRVEVRNPASAAIARDVEVRAGHTATIAHTFK